VRIPTSYAYEEEVTFTRTANVENDSPGKAIAGPDVMTKIRFK
jgi:hypothetical protein